MRESLSGLAARSRSLIPILLPAAPPYLLSFFLFFLYLFSLISLSLYLLSLSPSIPCCLTVLAAFAGAEIDALAVVHLDFDRLVTAVATDVGTNVVALLFQFPHGFIRHTGSRRSRTRQSPLASRRSVRCRLRVASAKHHRLPARPCRNRSGSSAPGRGLAAASRHPLRQTRATASDPS